MPVSIETARGRPKNGLLGARLELLDAREVATLAEGRSRGRIHCAIAPPALRTMPRNLREIGPPVRLLLVETVMSEQAFPTLLFGRITTVFGEHPRLLDTAKRLRAMCTSLADEEPEDNLQMLVDEFCSQLAAHFAAEEAGPYFGTLITDRPQLSKAVVSLQVEHGEMRQRFDLLRELAAAADRQRELRKNLEELLDQFELHERRENLLLQEFFARDDGSAGQ